jgi:uncharacterized surface protein with fasciclin (FAS1) repeats
MKLYQQKYTGTEQKFSVHMAFLIVALLLFGCKHDRVSLFEPNLKLRPAGEFINNNYEFKLFSAALRLTHLTEVLNGPGPFTVFAPTDLAFNNMGIMTPADLQKMNVDSLRDMLKYHIVTQRVSSMDVAKMTVDNPFNTLRNIPVYLALGQDVNYNFYINGSRITKVDVDVSNGIFHVIDKVIKYHPGTVKQYLESKAKYSIFVAALKKFNLLDQLSSAGPWTVMVPPNSAFEKIKLTQQDIEKMDPTAFKNRLFGIYTFKLQFFRSDLYILTKKGGNGGYDPTGAPIRLPIPGDEEYSYGMGDYFINLFVIKTSISNYPIVRQSMLGPDDTIDILNTNGMVHELENVVVYPDEAIIRK